MRKIIELGQWDVLRVAPEVVRERLKAAPRVLSSSS